MSISRAKTGRDTVWRKTESKMREGFTGFACMVPIDLKSVFGECKGGQRPCGVDGSLAAHRPASAGVADRRPSLQIACMVTTSSRISS